MPTATTTVSPATLYLANLSAGSQGMRQPLDAMAKILDADHDADSYPWHELTYRDCPSLPRHSAIEYRDYNVSTASFLDGPRIG